MWGDAAECCCRCWWRESDQGKGIAEEEGGRRMRREKQRGEEERGKGQRVRANEGAWLKAVGNVREKGAEKDWWTGKRITRKADVGT